ncbi:unnamed protein product, partial [Rotaria magnacalcarata]
LLVPLLLGSINAGAAGGPLPKPLGNGGGGGGGGAPLEIDIAKFKGGAGGILLFLFDELSPKYEYESDIRA